MIGLSTEWKREMSRAYVEHVWLVELTARKISDGSYTTFTFVSGDELLSKPVTAGGAVVRYTPSVASVKEIAYEIDPLTRSFSAADQTITFLDDGALRDVVANYYLLGQKVVLKLGCKTLSAWDVWQQVGIYVVASMKPSGGQIELVCTDVVGLLQTREVTRTFIHRHPAEIVKMILQDVDVPADLYDASSMDHTGPPYDGSTGLAPTSHWCATRYNNTEDPSEIDGATLNAEIAVDSEPADQLVADLTGWIYGTFFQGADGRYKLDIYDDSKASVATWTLDDIEDFEVEQQWTNVITQVVISQAGDREFAEVKATRPRLRRSRSSTTFPGSRGEHFIGLRMSDASVESDYAASGYTRKLVHRIDTRWGNGNASWRDVIRSGATPPYTRYNLIHPSDKEGTRLIFRGAHVNGFCGSNFNAFPHLGTTQEAPAPVNLSDADGRYSYILLSSRFYPYQEIIRCKKIETYSPSSTLEGSVEKETADDGTELRRSVSRWMSLTVKARDVQSLLPNSQTNIWVYSAIGTDVTTSYSTGQRILKRFRRGAPIVRCRTDVSQWGVEVGDFVTLPQHPVFLDHGADGVPAGNKYEVVSKELLIDGDSPGIQWTLCRAVAESSVSVTLQLSGVRLPVEWNPPTIVVDDTGAIVKTDDEEIVTL